MAENGPFRTKNGRNFRVAGRAGACERHLWALRGGRRRPWTRCTHGDERFTRTCPPTLPRSIGFCAIWDCTSSSSSLSSSEGSVPRRGRGASWNGGLFGRRRRNPAHGGSAGTSAAAATWRGGSVVLLAGALGWLIRRPWKGVLFERHIERPQGLLHGRCFGDVEGLCVPMCAAQLECGRRASRLCHDFDLHVKHRRGRVGLVDSAREKDKARAVADIYRFLLKRGQCHPAYSSLMPLDENRSSVKQKRGPKSYRRPVHASQQLQRARGPLASARPSSLRGHSCSRTTQAPLSPSARRGAAAPTAVAAAAAAAAPGPAAGAAWWEPRWAHAWAADPAGSA